MSTPVYFIIACWIVFGIFWRVTAYSTKETVERQPIRERVIQTAYVLAAFSLMWSSIGVRNNLPVLTWKIVPTSVVSAATGMALCAIGLAVSLWARVVLGGNWSGIVTFKRDHELIQSGPYRFVRHPIYTGMLTMFLGSAFVIGTVGAFVGFPLMLWGFWTKSRTEEALMEAHFPDAYPTYKQQVKALIPFVL